MKVLVLEAKKEYPKWFFLKLDADSPINWRILSFMLRIKVIMLINANKMKF